MGKKGSESIGKRLRELEKAEKAAAKRDRRTRPGPAGPPVASSDDLRSYGLPAPRDRDRRA